MFLGIDQNCLRFLQDFNSKSEQCRPSESSFKLKCILEALKDYQKLLDHRNNLLVQSSEYFTSFYGANIKLDQLESQIIRSHDDSELGYGSQNSATAIVLENVVQQLEQLMMDILGQGKALLNQANDRKEGTSGIRESMFHIENRVNTLRSNCHLKLSQVRINYTY